MKKLIAISFILIPFYFLGSPLFAQKPTTAFELNNYLSDMLDSVYSKGVNWGNELANAEENGTFGKLTAPRMEMEKILDKNINDVRALTDIGGSADFRKAVINFFSLEKIWVTTTFKPFEKLTSSSPNDEVEKLENNLESSSDKEDAELDKVRKVQRDYAAKNGFTVTPDGDETVKPANNAQPILDHSH